MRQLAASNSVWLSFRWERVSPKLWFVQTLEPFSHLGSFGQIRTMQFIWTHSLEFVSWKNWLILKLSHSSSFPLTLHIWITNLALHTVAWKHYRHLPGWGVLSRGVKWKSFGSTFDQMKHEVLSYIWILKVGYFCVIGSTSNNNIILTKLLRFITKIWTKRMIQRSMVRDDPLWTAIRRVYLHYR